MFNARTRNIDTLEEMKDESGLSSWCYFSFPHASSLSGVKNFGSSYRTQLTVWEKPGTFSMMFDKEERKDNKRNIFLRGFCLNKFHWFSGGSKICQTEWGAHQTLFGQILLETTCLFEKNCSFIGYSYRFHMLCWRSHLGPSLLCWCNPYKQQQLCIHDILMISTGFHSINESNSLVVVYLGFHNCQLSYPIRTLIQGFELNT